MGRERAWVGVLWSAVAIVRSGWRTRSCLLPEARERLRARHFVDEVEIDREDGRRIWLLGRQSVRVPQILSTIVRAGAAAAASAGFHGRAA